MYKVYATAVFEKIKNKLKKKYPHIEKDYAPLVKNLKKGIFDGVKIQGFAGTVYKTRIGSIDQKKGKSGGFRIIYYLIINKQRVYLLILYPKSMKENIKPNEINEILDRLNKFS